MSAHITLTVMEGVNHGQEYSFGEQSRCIVGRSEDCDIQVPMSPENLDISRHHCVFEVEPPTVRIRDLGSSNGTYVNGVLIGRRSYRTRKFDTELPRQATLELKDGDEVRVGHLVFRIGVHAEELVEAGLLGLA